jgi:Cu+-exporting ATPase
MTRLWVSAALAVPVVVLGMIPAWQFPGWQWVSFVLAVPVVVWGGGLSTARRSRMHATAR